MHNEKLLYPVLAIGCFFALFLVGYIVAYQFGLHPLTGALLGLITGCAGISLVVRLERLDPGA